MGLTVLSDHNEPLMGRWPVSVVVFETDSVVYNCSLLWCHDEFLHPCVYVHILCPGWPRT